MHIFCTRSINGTRLAKAIRVQEIISRIKMVTGAAIKLVTSQIRAKMAKQTETLAGYPDTTTTKRISQRIQGIRTGTIEAIIVSRELRETKTTTAAIMTSPIKRKLARYFDGVISPLV